MLKTISAGFLKALKVKRLESELPFATRYFAQLLSLGIGPEEALKKISEMNFGELSTALLGVIQQFKKGSSLEKAFSISQKEIGSKNYDRFVSIVLQTCRIGVTGESSELALRLARHFIEEKKSQYQEFASKSSLLSMLVVTLTALLPAVLAFIIAFTGTFSQTPALIYAIFLVLLPLLSLLMFAKMKTIQPD